MLVCIFFVFFKQKTAYELRITDWSSDVCSSALVIRLISAARAPARAAAAPQPRVTPATCLTISVALAGFRDRKRVVSGKSVSVRVALGGSRIHKNKKPT